MTSENFKRDFDPYQPQEDEEYMSESQREHFRAILMTWKEQLMEESKRTLNHMQDEYLQLPDPNDRASQEEEFSIELRARDRDRKLLHKIEKSLDRLANDEYGYCELCGAEIGLRRLEARPTADLCIDCKQLEEKKEKSWAA
jgi:DnaK suppressor protein